MEYEPQGDNHVVDTTNKENEFVRQKSMRLFVRAYVENLTRHAESHGKTQFVTRDTRYFDKFFSFFEIYFFEWTQKIKFSSNGCHHTRVLGRDKKVQRCTTFFWWNQVF